MGSPEWRGGRGVQGGPSSPCALAGRGLVSHHAHHGPVKFLVVAAAALKADKDRPRDSPPPGADPQDDEQRAKE